MRYAFVAAHCGQFSVRVMCRCLPGGRHRSLLTPRGRLVDAEPPDNRRCVAGFAHGRLAPETEGEGPDPFGPEQPILQHGLGRVLAGSQPEHSTSPRGNCRDNAVAERFFNLLKRKRIRRKSHKTREEARQDMVDHIEMFCNPKRKHARNGMLSPVAFERQRNL